MNRDTTGNLRWPDKAAPGDELRALQLVRTGSLQFGVFADAIAMIAPWREPVPLPLASASVLGVVSLQGRMLTVLELRTLAGGEANDPSVTASERRIIALRGDEQLALAVDGVGDVVKVVASDLKPEADHGNLILRKLQLEGSEVNVLNLRDLFPAAIQGRERRRRRF